MKELKVTLYDVFGYLVPGGVILLGFVVLYWSIFLPSAAMSIGDLPAVVWIVLGVGAYLLGHFGQAVANIVPWAFPRRESLAAHQKESNHSASPILIGGAKRKISGLMGLEANAIDDSTVLDICSRAAKLCEGAVVDEMFGYREGFYRGLSVGFLFLSAATVIRSLRGVTSISIAGGPPYRPGIYEFIFFAVLFAGLGVLAAQRYRRFAIYRAKHSLIAFLFGYPAKSKPSATKEGE